MALAEQEREARAEARKVFEGCETLFDVIQAQTATEDLDEDLGKTSGLLGGLEIANPNLNKNKMMKTKDLRNMGEAEAEEPQLSRREREALEAARRKAEYDRLHAAGTAILISSLIY